MEVVGTELKYPTVAVRNVYCQLTEGRLPNNLRTVDGDNSIREMSEILMVESWLYIYIDHDVSVPIIETEIPALEWSRDGEESVDDELGGGSDDGSGEDDSMDEDYDGSGNEDDGNLGDEIDDGSLEDEDDGSLGPRNTKHSDERVKRYKSFPMDRVYKKTSTPYRNSSNKECPLPEQVGGEGATNDAEEGEQAFGPGHLLSDSDDEEDVEPEKWFVAPKQSRKTKKKKKSVYYNPDAPTPNIELEQRYLSHNDFKAHVKLHVATVGCNLEHLQNEPRRQRFKAVGRCKWEVYAAWDRDAEVLMVKTLQPTHTCRKTGVVDILDSNWVADMFWKEVSEEPSTRVADMVKKLKTEKGLVVSWEKCRRAKRKILTKLAGNYVEQFGMLQGYADYVLSLNRENTVKLKFTLGPNGEKTFERMYVAYGVIKNGWMNGCRRVIGVDGCFLKGAAKGILLSAVGRDGNNQMYPIAWCVVESESSDS